MVKHIFIDFDGVLTDGTYLLDCNGNRFKRCSALDNRALQHLASQGYSVTIITTSDWEGTKGYAKRASVNLLSGITNKYMTIKSIVGSDSYYAVGDDVYDLEMLAYAEQAFIPKDSFLVDLSDQYDFVILPVLSGKGVVAELDRYLSKHSYGGNLDVKLTN